MVAPHATPTFQHALTAARSDNDMYNHMNNSVYYYLYVYAWM